MKLITRKHAQILVATTVIIMLMPCSAAFAINDSDKTTDINQLTRPITTPSSINTNLQQIKNYADEVSTPQEKLETPKVIVPAVDRPSEKAVVEMPAVYIKQIQFGSSEIFSDSDLSEFSSYIVDKKVTADDINNLINTINVSYRQKGYITAKAYLPPQELEGGVIRIEFIEGKIGEIIVQDNKYTRKSYIVDKFQEQPGELFKLKALQYDVNRFNLSNDNVKIVPGLKAGKAPGTTDIYLNVKESFPLHFTPSFDNFGRESVGLYRTGLVLTHNSLLGYQDRLTTGTYLGRSSVSNFEDYSFPIFNKGTRVGGTFSYSNVSVTSGMYKDYDIKGNTFLYSAYVQQPIHTGPKFSLSSSLSANFKNSTTDIGPISAFSDIGDKSLTASIFGKYIYKHGMIYSSHAYTNGILENNVVNTRKWFTKYEGNITSIHNLPFGITNIFKTSVQFTPHQLQSIEQFQLGGMGTVRGFSEGLLLGNNGYLFSEELLFPIPILPKKIFNYKLRDNVRLATFVDHGAAFPFKDLPATNKDFLTSIGAGIRIKLTRFLTARTYLGIGFNSSHYDEKSTRFHFDLISNPF